MTHPQNNFSTSDLDSSVEQGSPPSLSDIMMLFPLQAESIREEAISILNAITDDFLDHYAAIGTTSSESDMAKTLQSGCMQIIERLQYVDKLSQRLSHLEHGLQEIATSLNDVNNLDKHFFQHADVPGLLSSVIENCHMVEEKTLIEKYLQEHNISINYDSKNL